LNAANGAQLWSHSTDSNGPFTINDGTISYYGYSTDASINNGVLYYYSGKTLYALDTSNGNSLWNYTTNSNQSFLTVANSTAFFDAGNTVYALSVPDAEGAAVGLDVGSIEQVLIILSIIALIVVPSAIVLAKKRMRK
jgi:outer membrane protein assembly factor BamB